MAAGHRVDAYRGRQWIYQADLQIISLYIYWWDVNIWNFHINIIVSCQMIIEILVLDYQMDRAHKLIGDAKSNILFDMILCLATSLSYYQTFYCLV